MGQLLNRLSKIFQTEWNNYSQSKYDDIIQDEDEELKRIINELNNKESKKNSTNSNSYHHANQNNQSIDPKLIDAFRVLGLNINASNDEIKSRYKKLIKENHPDKFGKSNLEKQKDAQKKSQEINYAFNFIKKNRNFN